MMSDNMVERAARAHSPALWEKIDNLAAKGENVSALREDALGRMFAAIAAMREPTEAMYGAGKRQIGVGHDPARNYSDHVWRAMIDEALKP